MKKRPYLALWCSSAGRGGVVLCSTWWHTRYQPYMLFDDFSSIYRNIRKESSSKTWPTILVANYILCTNRCNRRTNAAFQAKYWIQTASVLLLLLLYTQELEILVLTLRKQASIFCNTRVFAIHVVVSAGEKREEWDKRHKPHQLVRIACSS